MVRRKARSRSSWCAVRRIRCSFAPLLLALLQVSVTLLLAFSIFWICGTLGPPVVTSTGSLFGLSPTRSANSNGAKLQKYHIYLRQLSAGTDPEDDNSLDSTEYRIPVFSALVSNTTLFIVGGFGTPNVNVRASPRGPYG